MKYLLTLALVASLATVSFAQDEAPNKEMTDTVKMIQKICPVSGKELGEGAMMGEVDGKEMMVCCAGCKGKSANEKHMKTIMASFAKAQGNCPIMAKKSVKPTSKMTMVKGVPVFACCSKCVKKIESDGEAALKTVMANYKTYVGDKMQIAAQKICPVSGKELSEDAIKTEKDGETVFLCCEGCKGKNFSEDHWKTIKSNLAEAQGTCLIMGNPVSGDKESTVVNGRRIFVCCPPCIAKLEADADKFVSKLNSTIADSMANKQ